MREVAVNLKSSSTSLLSLFMRLGQREARARRGVRIV